MAEIRKIEIQDSTGNTYYPKTSSEVILLDKSGKTLNEFFANGGTINGDVTVNDKIYTKYILSSDKFLRLFTSDSKGVIVDTNVNRIIPSTNRGMTLGANDYRFQELYSTGIDVSTPTGSEKIKIKRNIDGNDCAAYMRVGSGGQAVFGLTSHDDDNFAAVLERNSDGRKLFRPFIDNSHELGVSSYRWKDLWLGGSSKGSSGYTKLPNGLILQWGEIVLTGTNAQGFNEWPQFPVSFPTACLNISGNASPRDVNTNPVPCNFYIEITDKNKYHYRFSGATSSVTTKIQWQAIGY